MHNFKLVISGILQQQQFKRNENVIDECKKYEVVHKRTADCLNGMMLIKVNAGNELTDYIHFSGWNVISTMWENLCQTKSFLIFIIDFDLR